MSLWFITSWNNRRDRSTFFTACPVLTYTKNINAFFTNPTRCFGNIFHVIFPRAHYKKKQVICFRDFYIPLINRNHFTYFHRTLQALGGLRTSLNCLLISHALPLNHLIYVLCIPVYEFFATFMVLKFFSQVKIFPRAVHYFTDINFYVFQNKISSSFGKFSVITAFLSRMNDNKILYSKMLLWF